MKLGLFTMLTVFVLASCGQTIQGQCSAKHQGDAAAASKCVKVAESRILNRPGSAFARKQRGGPG